MQQSGGKFRRKTMDFPYLPAPLLLEVDKCFINQLWPFSYMSKTSRHSAGKLLEKVLLLPLDITNSGWYLWYLLVVGTLYHMRSDSGMFGTCVTYSVWTAWFVCTMQIVCIIHSALWTGWLYCVQINSRLHTIQSFTDIQYIQYFIGTLDSLCTYWTDHTYFRTRNPREI